MSKNQLERASSHQCWATNRNVLLILVGIYFAVQLPFLTSIPQVDEDEIWYASVGYNLIHQGDMVDLFGYDQWINLHAAVMGLFFSLFGTSILVVRLVSLLWGVLGLLGLARILQRLETRNSLVLFVGILFIGNNIVYLIYRNGRPEGAVLAVLIWGIYFLVAALQQGTKRSFVLCGLCTALSFVCHPNTALYLFLFGVMTVAVSARKRSAWPVLCYAAGGLAVLVCMFAYIVLVKQKDLFTYFEPWLGRTSFGEKKTIGAGRSGYAQTDNFFANTWMSFHYYTSIYALGIKRAFVYVCEVGVLIAGLCFWRKNSIVGVLSLLGLVYFILAVTFLNQYSPRHFGEVFVMSLIGFGVILQRCPRKSAALKVLCLLACIYLLNGVAGVAYLVHRDRSNVSYCLVEQEVMGKVPPGSTVMSVMEFWLPLADTNFYCARTSMRPRVLGKWQECLERGDVDYIVLSDFKTIAGKDTSGRKKSTEGAQSYYDVLREYSQKNGDLLESHSVGNYRTIDIYRIRKPPPP